MAKYSWLNRICEPLRTKSNNQIYNMDYISHYKIYNEIDGYSYFGITKHSWLNRVASYIDKRNSSEFRLRHTPKSVQDEILDETLYGKGPMETGHNRVGAAILRYGFQNFTCQLLSRGAMTRQVAEAIEDRYINSSEKVYNWVKNQQPDVSSSIINKYKSSEYDYVDYKNNKWKGFSCDSINLDQVCVLLREKQSFFDQIF